MKKYILILLLFCSCATTMKINGAEVKVKKKRVDDKERAIYIACILIGCALIANYVPND